MGCPRCLAPDHELVRCPYVKALDWRRDGTVRRAEFLTPADMRAMPPKKDDAPADGENYPRKRSIGG